MSEEVEGSVSGCVRVMSEASVGSCSDSVQSGQASNSSKDSGSTSDESSKKLEKTKSEEANFNDIKEMFGPSSHESARESPESSSASSTSVKEMKGYIHDECFEVEGDIISLFTPVAYEKAFNGRVTVLGHEHHSQPVSLKYIDGVGQLFPLHNCVITML